MRHTILPLAAALLWAAGSAQAQQPASAVRLEVGEWTGTVVPPEGHPAAVVYDVAYAGDTLKIKIRAGEHGTFETWEVKAEGNKLSFKFRPGPEVVCVLEKKENAYAGQCTADDGSVASMDLAPPRKQKS
ncbi:MAG TPA: hypothetical protein VFY80_03845 [Burkholderiales bacterium]|nr:hypothetical protein [Burkholderiales bacterium]